MVNDVLFLCKNCFICGISLDVFMVILLCENFNFLGFNKIDIVFNILSTLCSGFFMFIKITFDISFAFIICFVCMICFMICVVLRFFFNFIFVV